MLELEFVLRFLYLYLVSCACQTIKYIPSKNVKASSYIAQYLILRTVQSALHFTSLTDLFTQPPPRLLWEISSHMLQLMREGCSYTYPPLSIVRYSFIQPSELEQCRIKKLAQSFNTAAQNSNPGSRSRESEALLLSHGALQSTYLESLKYRIIQVSPLTYTCDAAFYNMGILHNAG